MKLDKKTIDLLLNCNWLSKCSAKDSKFSFDLDIISDIGKVSPLLFSDDWENVRFDARGEVTEFLSRNHPKAYNSFWNKGVQSIRTHVIPKVEPIIIERIKCLNLDEKVYAYMRMDIINIAMVLSYSEYTHSEFYEKLLEVYLNGHLPCGWNGSYPDGKMAIF